MNDNAVKSVIQNYIAANRVDATSRDLTRLHATSATTGACADLRAESVAQVPMRLQSKSSGEVIEDHPLNKIFSGRYSFQDIMRRSEYAMYYWGRNLLQKNRNAFMLASGVTWVNPNIYSLDTLTQGGLRGFRVYAGSRYQIEPVAYVFARDAVYMHEMDFDDDYEGVSPAERAFLEASTEVEMAQSVLATFRNMAIPAAIVQPAADANSKPSKDDRDNLVGMLRRVVQGAVNTGKTVVSPSRWEWIQLQSALKDQATDAIAANARKAVCIASRVPLELIEPSAANYATFEGARRAWGNSWLIPRVKWYASIFTEQLAREYGDDVEVVPDFDEVSFLKEDAAARVNVVTAKASATLISLYDAQKEIGDVPDDALKDMYLVQGIPVPKAVLPTLWQYHFAPQQAAPSFGGGGFGALVNGANALAPAPVQEQPPLTLLPRPQETAIPALPAPASASESVSVKAIDAEAALKELKAWQAIAAREKPREGKGVKWGRDYPFVMTTDGAAIVQAYVRIALDDGDDVAEVFAVARELVTDGAKAWEDTRSGFVREMTKIIGDAQTNSVSRSKFGGSTRSIVRRYGLMSFRDGMESEGYSPESFSPSELAIFRAYQEEASKHLSAFGDELFKQGGISEAEIAIRADAWANVTLRSIYYKGAALAAGTKPKRWKRNPAKDSCSTCVSRDGQIKTYAEWEKIGLPGDFDALECHGIHCGCELVDP